MAKRIDIKDWPAMLERQIAALPVAVEGTLVELGVVAEKLAKEKFGEYQVGWPKLAESTVADKEQMGFAPPDNPLLRTGDTRDSVSCTLIGDLPGSGAVDLVLGSPSEIMLFHELGTSNMPPRPVLGPTLAELQPLAQRLIGDVTVKVLSS